MPCGGRGSKSRERHGLRFGSRPVSSPSCSNQARRRTGPQRRRVGLLAEPATRTPISELDWCGWGGLRLRLCLGSYSSYQLLGERRRRGIPAASVRLSTSASTGLAEREATSGFGLHRRDVGAPSLPSLGRQRDQGEDPVRADESP